MLILNEDVVINLNNVIEFYKDDNSMEYTKPYRIIFLTFEELEIVVCYKTEKERNSAFNKILKNEEAGAKLLEI